tara:strand:- start:6836 stop:7906 length:1071 start_codon:yes stop_codon:yes gene_type:complete
MSFLKTSDLKKPTTRDSYRSVVYDFDKLINMNIDLKNTVFKDCETPIDIVKFIVNDLSLGLNVKSKTSNGSHYWALYNEIAISHFHNDIKKYAFVAFHELAHFFDDLFFNDFLPAHHSGFLFCYEYILDYYNVINKKQFAELVHHYNTTNFYNRRLPYIKDFADIQKTNYYDHEKDLKEVKREFFDYGLASKLKQFNNVVFNLNNKKHTHIINNQNKETLKIVRNLLPFEKKSNKETISFSNVRIMDWQGVAVTRMEYGGWFGFNINFDKKLNVDDNVRDKLNELIHNTLNQQPNYDKDKHIIIKKRFYSDYMVILFEDDLPRSYVNKMKTVVKNTIKHFFDKDLNFNMNDIGLIF